MNERIRLLWEEAAKTTQGNSWEEQKKFMERYTELIVRECVNICMKHRAGNQDYNTGRLHCSFDIKDHFGVEE